MTVEAPAIPDVWLEKINGVPGFDPFRLAGDCYFDADWAEMACGFFPEMLKHAKGPKAGKAFALEEWQKAVLANLYGWRRPDGTRRFRSLFLYVAKKNGKTALSAGLLVFGMTVDSGFGSECYSGAASRDQAALVFSHVHGFIRQDRDLAGRFKVFGGASGTGHRAVTDESRGIAYKCLSADANTADGVNVHYAIIDELHRHRSPELASVLERSTAADGDPLVVYTTTADYDRESVCNSKLEYAKGVRDGQIDDPELLPVIYEASEGDDWTKRETWAKANPNLGVTVPESYFERQVALCKQQPSEIGEFLRLHNNVRTKARNQWLDLQVWRECTTADDPVEWRKAALEALKGRRCTGGLDLGVSWDFTALALWFSPEDEDGLHAVMPWFWIPSQGGWRRDNANAHLYDDWIRRGFIKLTPGNVIDHSAVRADILALAEDYPILTLACDPWNAIQIMTDLQGEGVNVVQFRQGFASMTAPSKEFERLVSARQIDHGSNPVLDWMAGAAEAQSDTSGNLKPVKPGKNSPLKVDGIVSAIMALGVSLTEQGPQESVYETRGLLEFEL